MKKPVSLFFLLLLSISLFTCRKDAAIIGKKLHIKVFVKNLEIPWGMDFLPNGDFIFSERDGKINLLKKGASTYDMVMFRFVEVSEGGLLGIAADPDFSNTQHIYIYETTTADSNRVVRLKLENDVLTEEKIILKGIPKGFNHDGGALRFGPDGFLYVGTGDALIPNLAQDKSSMAGKILRIDKNGNAAPGNPFNNRVWSYGHRNVQGFDWNKDGKMIATEHGPTSEFGWCCHDEINLIEPGKNYGWPLALGGTEQDTLTPPLYHSGNDTWAPSGGIFINGPEWTTWENNFVAAGLRGQRLIRFSFDGSTTSVLEKNDTLTGVFGRLRNILQAPDGSIYFTSSNLGSTNPLPLPGDDKIYKLSFE